MSEAKRASPAIASAFAILLGISLAAPTHTAQAADEPSPSGTVLGTTQGWLNGRTVSTLSNDTTSGACPGPGRITAARTTWSRARCYS
jgi:hypothetical protein